ncbi:MAG: hypothetical protein HOP35_02095 [Nitrospira sp.]|nr:hypothetical protein [Nitrospira sp.]
MPEKNPLQVPAHPATIAEAAAAIEALYSDKPKLHKLYQYARFRIEGIEGAAEGYAAEDILSEAVTRTLEGDRKWNKTAVDIVGHLIGVMKSLSSHMAESVCNRNVSTYLESEVMQVTKEGDVVSPLEQHPSSRPGPDRILEAHQKVDYMKQAFKEDKEVSQVIEALQEGFNGPETQELLGISQTEYETRMRRMRRKKNILDEGRRAIRA